MGHPADAGFWGRHMSMKKCAILTAAIGLCVWPVAPVTANAANVPAPILVELFTSEGCSSCPPADQLLQKMDTQPFPSVDLVVLSEHVTYWDQQGWRDAYSSAEVTERQRLYQQRLHFDEVYTPQMVIDGTHQFTGSDGPAAAAALKAVAPDAKIPVSISAISVDHKIVNAHIAIAAGDGGGHTLGVFAVLALNHAETDVKSGENAHKQLTHTAVVRTLTRVSSLKPGAALEKDIRLKMNFDAAPKNLRVVVFLQDEMSMKVYGATMRTVE
jgi:hypothetical protein